MRSRVMDCGEMIPVAEAAEFTSIHPDDQPGAEEAFRRGVYAEYHPDTVTERQFVDCIANNLWQQRKMQRYSKAILSGPRRYCGGELATFASPRRATYSSARRLEEIRCAIDHEVSRKAFFRILLSFLDSHRQMALDDDDRVQVFETIARAVEDVCFCPEMDVWGLEQDPVVMRRGFDCWPPQDNVIIRDWDEPLIRAAFESIAESWHVPVDFLFNEIRHVLVEKERREIDVSELEAEADRVRQDAQIELDREEAMAVFGSTETHAKVLQCQDRLNKELLKTFQQFEAHERI